jgi:hypothetical protein
MHGSKYSPPWIFYYGLKGEVKVEDMGSQSDHAWDSRFFLSQSIFIFK